MHDWRNKIFGEKKIMNLRKGLKPKENFNFSNEEETRRNKKAKNSQYFQRTKDGKNQ